MVNRPIRLLLLENSVSHIREIRTMIGSLQNMSVEIIEAHSLEESLKRINSGIDVIVMNPLLPDSSGFDSFVRVHDSSRNVPVIILSDADDDVMAARALSSGAQDFLVRSRIVPETLARSIMFSMQRYHMLTDLEERVREFQAAEARFLNMIINNADGIVVVDDAGVVRFVNPSAESLFGRKADAFIGKPFGHAVRAGETHEVELPVSADRVSYLEMRVVETYWEGDKAFLISVRDIVMRKQAEKALRESEERYALAVRGSQTGVWDWDLATGRIYLDPQWKDILGLGDGEPGSMQKEWLDRIHDDERPAIEEAIRKHLEGEKPVFEAEYRIRHKDGSYRWVYCRGSAIRNEYGKAYRMAGSQTDITARKNAERELKQALSDLQFALASEKVLMEELDRKNQELMQLSITDGLTGLFNHRFIQERFDFEFKRVRRYGGSLACMMIDIDHFKMINDTYGHQFGDVVLRELSKVIKANTRDVDICGRYGGEEFMILSHLDAENAMKMATKLHSAIEHHPFSHESTSARVTVSIGVADFRNEILTKQGMIERADTALYEAKEAGRNLIRLWNERDPNDTLSIDRFSISELRKKFVHLSNKMRVTYMESTFALVRAVEAKDPCTQGHSEKVAAISVALARFIGVPEPEIEIIKYAALLHDVGKIGVSQEVLVKSQPLSEPEYELLKKHPLIGVNILKDVKFLEKELPIIMHHHERYDGKGYPHGLKGREIPLGARILAIAESFETMVSGRTYKRQYSIDETTTEIRKGSGTQFSPDLVDAFLKLIESGQFTGAAANA